MHHSTIISDPLHHSRVLDIIMEISIMIFKQTLVYFSIPTKCIEIRILLPNLEDL